MDYRESLPAPRAPFADRLAFAVSALCSPYVITAAAVLVIVGQLHLTPLQIAFYGAISVITGAIIPFVVVYALWRRQHLTDIHVAIRTQRALPFLSALLSGSLGVALLYAAQAPRQLVALGVVYVANGLMLALISLRWKISVHVAVLTAAIMAVAMVGSPLAYLGLLTVPAVLWARVRRGRHTLLQGLMPVLFSMLLTPLVYYATVTVLLLVKT